MTPISDASESVLACCLERDWTLAVAESCTGGLLGGSLTAIPGSSASFIGGVIAYSNAVKTGLLGVPREIIRSKGAVSEEAALGMAWGVARVTGADCGISITGIAGPDGGTPEKPVGTVWFAVIWPSGEISRLYRFPGQRAKVREQAVQAALDLFLEAVNKGRQ